MTANPADGVSWHAGAGAGGPPRPADADDAAELRRFKIRVYLRFGRMRAAQGRPSEAQAAYRRALELDPRNAAALRALGDLAEARGDRTEAERYRRRYLELSPWDGEVRQRVPAAGQLSISKYLGRLMAWHRQPQRAARRPATRVAGAGERGRTAAVPAARTHAPVPPDKPYRADRLAAGGGPPRVAAGHPRPARTGAVAVRRPGDTVGAGGARPPAGPSRLERTGPPRPAEPPGQAASGHPRPRWRRTGRRAGEAEPTGWPASTGAVPVVPPAEAVAAGRSGPGAARRASARRRAEASALQAMIVTADLMVGMLEYRDPYFRSASSLTRVLATGLARALGLSRRRTQEVALAAVLRDTGRLAAGEKLFPPREPTLTEAGHQRVERHVDLGLMLLRGLRLPTSVRRAIRHHHERWDGRGYPDGLRGPEIPLAARIIAVADAFAAMLQPRRHRLPRRIGDAMQELQRESGRQFDPAVVAATMQLLRTRDLRYFGLGRSRHVLVVHPDPALGRVMATRLCCAGYLAEATTELDVTRHRMRQMPVEAVALSARLGLARARRFIREVRDDPRWALLPIMILDADDPRLALDLTDAGADALYRGRAPFSELKSGLAALMGRAARQRSASSAQGGGETLRSLRGDLGEFDLGWLLQMIGYHGRTAAVTVQGPKGAGIAYLVKGELFHAESEGLNGQQALQQMLQWKTGRFAVHLGRRPPRRTIHQGLIRLLLEAAVDQDQATWTTFGAVTTE